MIKCEFCNNEYATQQQINLHPRKNLACINLQKQAKKQLTDDEKDNLLSEKVAQLVERRKEDAEEDQNILEDAQEDPKIKSSKPWEQKVMNEHSWLRPNILHVELKDKAFYPLWAREDMLDIHLEYATPVRYSELKSLNAATIIDGKDQNSIVTRRGMTLLKVPKEFGIARKKHLRTLNKTPEDMEREARARIGQEVYGTLGDGMGIKINK